MSERIYAHLRSNVWGMVAVFIALSGTAYATHPGGANTISSGDIINGQVRNADIDADAVTSNRIAPGGVFAGDLATNSVSSPKVVNGSLTNADVADTNSLGPAEIGELGEAELGTGSVGTDEIANFAIEGNDIGFDQVSGDHIVDGSVNAGDVSNVFKAGYGSDSDGDCADDDNDGEVCASTELTLNQPSKLLVNATGEWRTFSAGGDGVQMDCVLQVDGVNIGVAQSMGEAGSNHPADQAGTMALTALSPSLNTGLHTVQTFCTQINGDIDIRANQITAARVDF